jgi:hypothetical protein
MTYYALQIGSKTFWTAQPSNWEELTYTLNMETPFLDYDPNTIKEASDELLNLFL